ncbi:MAG: DUF4287 domain-containing protein [Prolixibacteraceae bacterium]|nr:DUF4287 domain-containing protein [Prolixibacteraceae bacterium]
MKKGGAKTGDIVACLKANFDLGHGYAMSIFLYSRAKPNS